MPKKKDRKMPVTERALMQRINRKLKPSEEFLRVNRSGDWNAQRYYRIDSRTNRVQDAFDDLEGYGRDTGALQPYEQLVTEKGGTK